MEIRLNNFKEIAKRVWASPLNPMECVSHAEHNPVLDPHEASTLITLDNLGIEQFGLRHPARPGCRAFGLAALGLYPLTVMRDERGEVLPKAVGQEQRGAVWSQYLGELMDEPLGHGQGALTDINRQDKLADRIHRHPHPVRRS
jgi:hypothetical protein